MFECYDNIFGFSQFDCGCTQDQRPADYNESTSGLFLDELTPINALIETGECNKNMWDILIESREEAVKQLVADTNGLLGKKYQPKRRPVYSQVLGEIRARQLVSPDMNYAVIRFACNPIRGGVINFRAIGGVFDNDDSIQISIYNNVEGLIDDSTILSVTGGSFSSQEFAFELPLYSKYVDILEYYIVYEFNPANPPRDTKIDCGCGGYEPIFDLTKPYFYNGINRKTEWSKFVMVGGAQINSLSELNDPDSLPGVTINKMFGLSIEADFTCKINEVLCENSLDFVGNPLALSLAFCVRYLAAIKVGESILKSPLLNRENMVLQEDWEHSIEDWKQQYEENIMYIINNVDHTANDCLKCRDLVELQRQGLFA